jgi:hypothetical protein
MKGVFPENLDTEHIGVKELFAIIRGLECFSDVLQDSTLVLFCDNQPAVFMLRAFATKSRACAGHVKRIYHILRSLRIVLDIKWVASKLNKADLPSRALLPHVYNEPPWLADYIRSRLRPTLHLFAGQQLYVDRFSTVWDHPDSLANPFVLDWSNEIVYMFPPLQDKLLYRLEAHIASLRYCHVHMLLPCWFSKGYLTRLLQTAQRVQRLRVKVHHGSRVSKPLRTHRYYLLLTFLRPKPLCGRC